MRYRRRYTSSKNDGLFLSDFLILKSDDLEINLHHCHYLSLFSTSLMQTQWKMPPPPPPIIKIFFFFLVFWLHIGRSSYRFDSLHPSLSSAILFSSLYDLPLPRLPNSVALLLPLLLLPSSFLRLLSGIKLFPLIMCHSHFFFLYFSVSQ